MIRYIFVCPQCRTVITVTADRMPNSIECECGGVCQWTRATRLEDRHTQPNEEATHRGRLAACRAELAEAKRAADGAALLVKLWHSNAIESNEEADRIRRTVKDATDAEMRCHVRGEVWSRCAEQLAARIGVGP